MSDLTSSLQIESVHKKINFSAYCFSFIHTEQWLLIFHVLTLMYWSGRLVHSLKTNKKRHEEKKLLKITSEKFQVVYLFHLSSSIIKML